MDEEEEDLEVVAADEKQGYYRNMNEDIDMMEDGDSDQNDEDASEEVDPLQKQRELERRLQSELNLRMGNIGYAFNEDEEED